MANNPQHGESIIKQVSDGFGGKKLIASSKFQDFLDDLGRIQLDSELNGDTEEQLISMIGAGLSSNSSSIKAIISSLDGQSQKIHINDAELSRLNAGRKDMLEMIDDSLQAIGVLQSLLSKQSSRTATINKRLDDLEQLINGN